MLHDKKKTNLFQDVDDACLKFLSTAFAPASDSDSFFATRTASCHVILCVHQVTSNCDKNVSICSFDNYAFLKSPEIAHHESVKPLFQYMGVSSKLVCFHETYFLFAASICTISRWILSHMTITEHTYGWITFRRCFSCKQLAFVFKQFVFRYQNTDTFDQSKSKCQHAVAALSAFSHFLFLFFSPWLSLHPTSPQLLPSSSPPYPVSHCSFLPRSLWSLNLACDSSGGMSSCVAFWGCPRCL